MSKKVDTLSVYLIRFLFLILLIFSVGIIRHSTTPKAIASTISTAVESSLQWQIECADCPKSIAGMGDRSIALDSSGNPIIAYGGDHLYLTWYDGSQWQYETVDFSPGVGSSASLALDGAGYPHISYQDSPSNSVKYAYKNASGWHYELVDSGKNGSLAIDKNNNIHIAYVASQNPNVLKYGFRDSLGWQLQFIDNGVVKGPFLVPFESGQITVVYGHTGRVEHHLMPHVAGLHYIPPANLL